MEAAHPVQGHRQGGVPQTHQGHRGHPEHPRDTPRRGRRGQDTRAGPGALSHLLRRLIHVPRPGARAPPHIRGHGADREGEEDGDQGLHPLRDHVTSHSPSNTGQRTYSRA